MEQVLSNYTASISELKKSPTKIIKQAKGESIAILNHNSVSSYLVPARVYENLVNTASDYLLAKKVGERLKDDTKAIKVSIDEL